MKTRIGTTLLIVGVTVAVLAGCGKVESTVSSPTFPSTNNVREKVISTKTATIDDVMFVNSYFNPNGDKEAVTRVYLKGENGIPLFMKHDFSGYHPEIVPGLKVTSTYLHQTGGNLSLSGRYVTRLCVNVIDQEPVCKDGD